MEAINREKLLVSEFSECSKNLENGIVLVPSVSSMNQWQGYLMTIVGPFSKKILTFNVIFNEFPARAPAVIFQSGIFHPLVDPSTSSFDVAYLFPKFGPQIRVYSILNAVFDSFSDVAVPSKAANGEAAAMLGQSAAAYAKKAAEGLPSAPNPSEFQDLNRPKRWSSQKEGLANAINPPQSPK